MEFNGDIFIKNIETLIKKHGLKSKKEFNDKIGYRGAATRWRSEKPSLDNLLKISSEFNCSIDWLLCGTTTNPGAAESQYIDLIRNFKDKQRALNISRELVELEKIDQDEFIAMEGYVRGTVNSLNRHKNSPINRRQMNRRNDLSEPPSGEIDRRSGGDRRKAG